MKIIKFLLCWFKAHFCTLGLDDFNALCDDFECSKHHIISQLALKKYFAVHMPFKQELDRIYAGNFDLRWLYLKSISPKRRLSDDEQYFLVCDMPTGGSFRFPSALRAPALKMLFERASPQKIGDYAEDFVLPTDYELRLIELCRKEKDHKVKFLNSFRRALMRYLRHAEGYKLMTPEVQMAVLALDDEEVTIAMIENCNLTTNILFMPVLKILVEQGSLNALKKLLSRSFIRSDELAQKMLQRFPQLKRAYDISCLRRPLYKLEKESKQFWGTEAPTMDEHQFIIHAIEADAEKKNREAFVANHLLPRLASAGTTPYFCAWCADTFPETGEQAYQKMRQIAKMYRDRYKK